MLELLLILVLTSFQITFSPNPLILCILGHSTILNQGPSLKQFFILICTLGKISQRKDIPFTVIKFQLLVEINS